MNKEIKIIFDKIPDTIEFIPDDKLFKETIFSLYESGNFNEAYRLLLYRLEDHSPTVENKSKLITFKYLFQKYDKYIIWWNDEFGAKDPVYISKKDKLQDLEDWLTLQGYNRIYAKQKSQTDDYLFGGFTESTLKRKLNIFLKLVNKPQIEINEENQKPTMGSDSIGGVEEPF